MTGIIKQMNKKPTLNPITSASLLFSIHPITSENFVEFVEFKNLILGIFYF